MNVTLNTVKTNNHYIAKREFAGNQNYKILPSFRGEIPIPTKSSFLNPFKRGMDKVTDFIAKNYTAKMYESKFANLLAKKSNKLDGIVGHMQTIGSAIISGLYMLETWRNKDLDDDRKPTLIVNQFLTLVAATVGAYTVDKSLNKWWDKLTGKYAKAETKNPNLVDDLAKLNKNAKALFEQEIKDGIRSKDTKFIPKKLDEYVAEIMPETNIAQRIKGMGILKKLLVFGVMYRFLSPVLVTPFANMIGNKFFSPEARGKKTKNIQASALQSNSKPEEKKSVETK